MNLVFVKLCYMRICKIDCSLSSLLFVENMRRKVIIFGITDLAEILYSYLFHSENYEVIAFCVDKEYLPKAKKFHNLPIYSYDQVKKIFSPNEYGIFICIGYKSMNKYREFCFKKVEKDGFEICSFVHPSALVLARSKGYGNIIFPNVVIDQLSEIGIGNVFYPCSVLSHHSTVGNFNYFSVKSCICGHVSITNNCFFGANCTIKNGVKVSSYTFVGASTYINKDTSDNSFYAFNEREPKILDISRII